MDVRPPGTAGPFRDSWTAMGTREILETVRYPTIRLIGDFSVTSPHESYDAAGVVYGDEDGRFRIRLYRYGMASADVLYDRGDVFGIPTSSHRAAIRSLLPLLQPLLFWWTQYSPGDRMERKEEAKYAGPIFSSPSGVTRLAGSTLTPILQILFTPAGDVRVTYDEAREFPTGWFPSRIAISGPGFAATVKIDKVERGIHLDEKLFLRPATGLSRSILD